MSYLFEKYFWLSLTGGQFFFLLHHLLLVLLKHTVRQVGVNLCTALCLHNMTRIFAFQFYSNHDVLPWWFHPVCPFILQAWSWSCCRQTWSPRQPWPVVWCKNTVTPCCRLCLLSSHCLQLCWPCWWVCMMCLSLCSLWYNARIRSCCAAVCVSSHHSACNIAGYVCSFFLCCLTSTDATCNLLGSRGWGVPMNSLSLHSDP